MRLINGIVEYDQKLSNLTLDLIHRHPIQKKSWIIFFYFVIAHYVGNTVIYLKILPLRVINSTTVYIYFIRLPYAFDVTVAISTYFYLKNLECRFQALNDFWTQLPDGLTTTPIVAGGWKHNEITMLMDKIRRLHAELCDLLRIFSTGFGQMLLGFFVFNYINIVISFFYNVYINFNTVGDTAVSMWIRIAPTLMFLQNIIFIMSVIIAASRVNDTKRKMISYLRLIRISSLPVGTKLQVKMFMNQLTIFDMDEITAYGIFNINLNLVISIIILVITGLITLVQMKNDPNLVKLRDALFIFYKNVTSPS